MESEIERMISEASTRGAKKQLVTGDFGTFADKMAKAHRKFESELKTLRQVQSAMPKVIFDQLEPKLEAIDLLPDKLEAITKMVDDKLHAS